MARICHNDYDREIALVVEGEESGNPVIYAIGRLSKLHGGDDEARLSMLVSDIYQGQGIGSELIKQLMVVAHQEKIKHLRATISPENVGMQKLCKKMGCSSKYINPETGMIEAELQI
jgi:acetyltransferase